MNKKKPVKTKDTLPFFPLHDHRAVSDEFKPLPEIENKEIKKRFSVLKADLDFNRHVNNAVYIQWAVETVPKKVAMNLRPARIKVNYKNETFYGNWVTSHTQKINIGENHRYIHQLFRESDGQEIARLRTEWADL